MSPERALLASLLLFQLLACGGHQGLTEIFFKLPDTGQPPILLSLADTVKLEHEDSSENQSIFGNHTKLANNTRTLVENENIVIHTENETTNESKSDEEVPEILVVQARPMHEVKLTEEAFMATSTPPPPKLEESEVVNNNETDSMALKAEQPQEDIPSFSEWAQKQLAEAEKQDTVLNHSSQLSQNNNGHNVKNAKLRSKNYASPACGAKVLAVNPEAGSSSSILSPNRDEYMLNTCNSRIWFTVELCEAVQAQKIELANFELFSSSPKDFVVYFSDRFPTREWTSVGQFTAKNDKEVQSFDLFPHLFGKFIKVEMLSHYGSEHYCPISLFKVYGTSEFEVLEKENSQHPDAQLDDDDDEILGDLPDVPVSDVEVSKNLFGSARDAVMSIMKKAAQVLVKSDFPKNITDQSSISFIHEDYSNCCTPSHIIVCDNCSDVLFNEVFDLISCGSNQLMNMIGNTFVHETLKDTEICQRFGLDFRNKRTVSFRNERAIYMSAIMSENYISALCNFMAIIDKKVVLNTSYETELNVTSNLTLDKVSNTVVNENNLHEIVQIPFKDDTPKTSDLKPSAETKVPIVPDLPQIQDEIKDNESSLMRNHDSKDSVISSNESSTNEAEDKLSDKNERKGDLQNAVTIEKLGTDEPKESLVTESVDRVINHENVKVETGSEAKKEPLVQENTNQIPVDKVPNGNMASPVTSDDITDPLVIETENFLSELDNIMSDPTVQTTATPNVPNNQGPPQKESVFLRLSNRVKTLERNMSLSAQYLEELSRRYKKQVEEMQKSFEKTLLQINEEKKKTEERDQQSYEQMSNLQQQLAQVNTAMQILLEERDSWFGNITFFKFILFQTVIMAIAYHLLNKKPVPEPQLIQTNRKSSRTRKNHEKRVRRKSVEGVSGHETPAGKKRRPSEEALHIARQSSEHLDDDDDSEWQVARKNRRRKTSIVHRSLNGDRPEWIRQDSIGVLQENVIPLDEEEFIAPVPEPTQFTPVAQPVPPKEFPKTNGSIMNTLKATKVKSRRLSSPAFFRSALSRQSSRGEAGQQVDVRGDPGRRPDTPRGPGGSPTISLHSQSTVSRENGICGSELNGLKQTKRRSFKNIFKKVF